MKVKFRTADGGEYDRNVVYENGALPAEQSFALLPSPLEGSSTIGVRRYKLVWYAKAGNPYPVYHEAVDVPGAGGAVLVSMKTKLAASQAALAEQKALTERLHARINARHAGAQAFEICAADPDVEATNPYLKTDPELAAEWKDGWETAEARQVAATLTGAAS